jgi:hypothetical protein
VKRLQHLGLASVLLALALQSCGLWQKPRAGSCPKMPKLEVVSLAMIPDPLPEARKINQWRVIVRSDSSELCQATLGIVEADTEKWVTPEQKSELSLGTNDVTFYALSDYRLSGTEVCFELIAHIGEDKISVDSRRRFCARTIDRGWWSMR